MNADELREIQKPLKQKYSESPDAAIAELHAAGTVDLASLTCKVTTPGADNGVVHSGLHPNAGGDGSHACSGDMLLQSLVACSGVTFAAVATAMELNIDAAQIEATGTMDFRGTLGVDREIPVGLTEISIVFCVESQESDEKIDKLIQLTERYCVVLQSLRGGVAITSQRADKS